MDKKIICLVPIKNEAWILRAFLESTSIWADYIILLDQNSTDSSKDIAKDFQKAIIIENKSNSYNEIERQQLLINKARELFGLNNILFALDADEILVNFNDNQEWEKVKTLPAGTAVYFPWLNVLPGNKTYFDSAGKENVFAYIDDGREHFGSEMHSIRVPLYPDIEHYHVSSIKVLHYQFSVRERQLSKHRWYECLEKIKYPDKDTINLYRMYHHIDVAPQNIYPIPESWYKYYENLGISLLSIKDDGEHWWDKELYLLLMKYGTAYFKKQPIWYVDWSTVGKKYYPADSNSVEDPRGLFDKGVHSWLKNSQNRPNSILNRIIAKSVRVAGW
jgi:hypothetical protein